MIRHFFFSLFFICLAFFPVTISSSVKDILNKIPQEDFEYLHYCFSYLDRDHFAYALFGGKPVSLSRAFTLVPWENTLVGGSLPLRNFFWKQWQVWEKYKKHFEIKNYILIKEQSHVKNLDEVILINKKEFVKVVNENLDLFQQTLKAKIDPHVLLAQLEKGEINFRECIQDNELLWGILLGFGKHNAEFYCRNLYCEHILLKEKGTLCSFGMGAYCYSPLIQQAVRFIADPDHPETKALQKKYREFQGKISAIYAKGDFLEITLSKLTED